MSTLEKIIEGFPLYRVTSDGRVFGPRSELKPQRTWKGYLRVCLRHGDEKYYVPIHKLVLEAFCCKRPDGMQARHLNGDKDDNRIENLRWGTVRENYEDKRAHGTDQSGERHGSSKLDWEKVREIRQAFDASPNTFLSRPWAEKYGVTRTSIQRIVSGKLWKEPCALAKDGGE